MRERKPVKRQTQGWNVVFFLIYCDSSVISSGPHPFKLLIKGVSCTLNSDTVGDFVGGHVVVGQIFALVPPLDDAGYLRQLLPELFHGVLHWLLDEVLIGIHAQVELQAQRETTRVSQPASTAQGKGARLNRDLMILCPALLPGDPPIPSHNIVKNLSYKSHYKQNTAILNTTWPFILLQKICLYTFIHGS